MSEWWIRFQYDHADAIILFSAEMALVCGYFALYNLVTLFMNWHDEWEPDICDQCGEKTRSIVYHKYVGRRCRGRPRGIKIEAQGFKPGERKW